MADIRLENITKRFDDFAIEKMNLEVKDKEFVVFLGPSGCGKTTTLRLIAGLEQADEGDIFIDDIRVNDLSPADRDITFVFQLYALYRHMTVYNNIAFPLKAVKVPKSEIDIKVKEVANILHIGHLLDRKPNKLGGGEMQRLVFELDRDRQVPLGQLRGEHVDDPARDLLQRLPGCQVESLHLGQRLAQRVFVDVSEVEETGAQVSPGDQLRLQGLVQLLWTQQSLGDQGFAQSLRHIVEYERVDPTRQSPPSKRARAGSPPPIR